jgi:hypothetical protein
MYQAAIYFYQLSILAASVPEFLTSASEREFLTSSTDTEELF